MNANQSSLIPFNLSNDKLEDDNFVKSNNTNANLGGPQVPCEKDLWDFGSKADQTKGRLLQRLVPTNG